MLKKLSCLMGFLLVVAYVPTWSQPAMEAKGLALLALGGAAWVASAWRGWCLPRFSWMLLAPLAWLLLSCAWSVSPLLGLQRVFWLMAAAGLAAVHRDEGDFDEFMKGFLLGATLHAGLIFLQWVPSVRPFLPATLGSDPFQGVGRGFFHNTNMAFQPLLIASTWLLLSGRDLAKRWAPALLWLLPAMALTQSRFGTAVACLLFAFSLARLLDRGSRGLRGLALPVFGILLSVLWSLAAHRWGWLFPLAGALLGLARLPRPSEGGRATPVASWTLCGGLLLSLLIGGGIYLAKNQPSAPDSRPQAAGSETMDASLAQRKSYYRVAMLGFLDRPLLGQGLGSARAVYPLFVDRDQPAAAIAYGDFTRPNNLHSEYLELLMEGGVGLLAAVALGFWLDRRKKGGAAPRRAQLAPLGLYGLLDFPFHNPVGMLWGGLCLARVAPSAEAPERRPWIRVGQGILGLALLALAVGQCLSAVRRPAVERAFQSVQDPAGTYHRAEALWRGYPFAVDVFDLYSKSAIQASALQMGGASGKELRTILQMDPWDHHLLLANAQAARREGDGAFVKACLDDYARVAPRDPARYLRLAMDALRMGRVGQARILALEAAKQPGFNAKHRQQMDLILAGDPPLDRGKSSSSR